MITVHHLNNSRSQRILWLLEELGLEYNIKRYERDPETMLAPDALRKVHPLGKSPVITDDAFTLAESGAIIEYLVDRYGSGHLIPPPNTPERSHYTYWLHYAEGSAMPPLVMKLIFNQVKAKTPFFLRPLASAIVEKAKSGYINPQIELHLDYMESTLEKSVWFAGDKFTAADIQISFPIEAAADTLEDKHIKLRDFLKRIHDRPAYKKALERGGEYELTS